jgi:phosphoglucomutase
LAFGWLSFLVLFFCCILRYSVPTVCLLPKAYYHLLFGGSMAVHPQAGLCAEPQDLVSVPALMAAYYTLAPDAHVAAQQVSFGTSGHRGSSLKQTFNEAHICAITQAVCDFRRQQGITGPLFMAMDTHALSEAAFCTALEVLAANGVCTYISQGAVPTPTPALSHAIVCWNREHAHATPPSLADGIIITPSHNPPQDGGFKYNPPHGGPAESTVTKCIEKLANGYLQQGNARVRRMPLTAARAAACVQPYDYVQRYVNDLPQVLDMAAIAASGLKLGVDPLGGASLPYWEPIAQRYGLDISIVNPHLDPTFAFVPRDKDGIIRMDCSSPYPMSRLLDLRTRFDLALACDPDADRHGIVTSDGLMNPNHYLATVVWHLLRSRTGWPKHCGVGKTLVTSGMLDRVAAEQKRRVVEVPVGFKWFVPYLHDGSCGMGCEESAGASFLCFDGSPWSTDKDGPLLCLLAAEMMAKEGKSPSALYAELTQRHGAPCYQRLDAPADDRTRQILLHLTQEQVQLSTVGGSPVRQVLTRAPGNNEPIGGVKVVTDEGWFAARPSGTEAICKVYTESFKDEAHLRLIQQDAVHFMEQLLAAS